MALLFGVAGVPGAVLRAVGSWQTDLAQAADVWPATASTHLLSILFTALLMLHPAVNTRVCGPMS